MTDFLEDGCQGFEKDEAESVLKDYVCSVCHFPLNFFPVPGTSLYAIVCYEHGNVEKCGRVMKSTVSIELERAFLKYKEVVRNLSDLWPGLAEDGFEYYEAESIRRHYVCRRCGGFLVMQFASNENMLIHLKCNKCHSNIEKDGYVRKGEFLHVANKKSH